MQIIPEKTYRQNLRESEEREERDIYVKIIISQSGLDAILAAVKDYYERIRELETDININVDGGTPKSTDLLLVKGGTPFTTDYDKYIAGTSHTI